MKFECYTAFEPCVSFCCSCHGFFFISCHPVARSTLSVFLFSSCSSIGVFLRSSLTFRVFVCVCVCV